MTPSKSEDGWWDLVPVWDEIYTLGNTIDIQKKDYRSNSGYRPNNDSHIIGFVGEYVIELETGVPFNREIRVGGDGGSDFKFGDKEVDVKCSTFVPDPDLKHPAHSQRWPHYFVLVCFDVPHKEAKLMGWATGDSLKNAKVTDYGYGPQRSINWKDLNDGLPPVFKRKRGG
jgi:hypothetical protein